MTDTSASFDSESPTEPLSDAVPAVDGFLKHCRDFRRLSVHTLRAYKCDLVTFLEHFGQRDSIQGADQNDIRDYVRVQVDVKRVKLTTLKRRLATLRTFFKWLAHEGLVSRSPFHELHVPLRLPKRLPRALSSHDMALMLNHSRQTLSEAGSRAFTALTTHLILITLFTTGIRVGELVAIELVDVSTEDGTIRVRGKGNRERCVYLPGREAIRVLHRYVKARDRVASSTRLFVRDSGLAMSEQHIRRVIRLLAEQSHVNCRVTPHMLRHTAATHLLEAGVDIRILQRLLGHASIGTTEIYTHVTDTALKRHVTLADTLSRIARTSP